MSEQQGLFGKYYISRADGSSIDPEAKRYDVNSKPSSAAIRKYAEQIRQSNPEFVLDLLKELDREYLKKLLTQTAD